MTSLLDFRATRLFAQATCPQCNSHKIASFRMADGAEPLDGCRVMVRFHCDATFSIGETDHIVCRTPCALASRFEADAMNIDADTAFEMQELAA
jgi:hypothetical protein